MNKKFITGFIAGAITFSSIGVFAAGGKVIEVFYSIKDIKIDNISQMPKQQPFTYNGTTFVPLRFIADKLGQPIKYDAETQTIFIGKFDGEKVYVGDGLQLANLKGTQFSAQTINETAKLKDVLENEYSKYILLDYKSTDVDKPSGEFEIPINHEYTKFNSTISFTENSNRPDKPIQFNIYADGKRIYAGTIEPGALPKDINLNIEDVRTLKFSTNTDSQKGVQLALFDAYLVKKN